VLLFLHLTFYTFDVHALFYRDDRRSVTIIVAHARLYAGAKLEGTRRL